MRARLLAAAAAILLLWGSICGLAMSRYPPTGGSPPVLLPVLLTPNAAVSLERQQLELVDDEWDCFNGEMVLRNSGEDTQEFQVGFPIVCSFSDYPKQLLRLARDGAELSSVENLRIAAAPDYSEYTISRQTDTRPANAMEYREQWASLQMGGYWQVVKDNPPYQPTLSAEQLFEGTTYTLTALQESAYVKANISCDPGKTLLMADMDSYGSPSPSDDLTSISTSSLFISDREGVKSSSSSFTLYWQGVPPDVKVESYGTTDDSTPVYRLEQVPAPATTLAQELGKQLNVYDNDGNARQQTDEFDSAQEVSKQLSTKDSGVNAWREPFKYELAYRCADNMYARDGILHLNPISYSYSSLLMTVTRVVDISLEPGETTTLAWSSRVYYGYDETLEEKKTLYYAVIERSPMGLWQQTGDTTMVLAPQDSTRNVMIDGVQVDKKLGSTFELSMDGTSNEPLFVSWQQRTKSHLSLSMQLFFFGLLALYYWPVTLLITVLIIWLLRRWLKQCKSLD